MLRAWFGVSVIRSPKEDRSRMVPAFPNEVTPRPPWVQEHCEVRAYHWLRLYFPHLLYSVDPKSAVFPDFLIPPHVGLVSVNMPHTAAKEWGKGNTTMISRFRQSHFVTNHHRSSQCLGSNKLQLFMSHLHNDHRAIGPMCGQKRTFKAPYSVKS